MSNLEANIVLFDGVCNLCNGAVKFIINRDKKDQFKFASLQSKFGQAQLKKHRLNPLNIDSFIYLKAGKVFIKSTAALKVANDLGRGWKLLYVFIVIPVFLRNWVYDRIAKNRYKMFGKREFCIIPTPELKEKFLE